MQYPRAHDWSRRAQHVLIAGGGAALVLLMTFIALQMWPPAKHSGSVPSAYDVLAKAARRALGGGIGGAIAGVCQVLALMWLRTAMNYQYRHGGTMNMALRTLYAQGGVARFYQGLPFALLQTPLSRFGDTATNSGILALFAQTGAQVPLGVRTACASAAGSLWRLGITPLDTCKTTLQVEGETAYELLKKKVRVDGVMTLWDGALANAAASFVGSYPWFLTFNALDELVPRADANVALAFRLLRSAGMACVATAVSDVVSNSLRVVKTVRQTSAISVTYVQATRLVLAQEGFHGLMCRGLGTRLLANLIQSALFAVVWKAVEASMVRR